MWLKIVESFNDMPLRLKVAGALICHGFNVEAPGVIKCGDVRIPLKAIGDALDIDRRTVRATTEDICNNEDIFKFFSLIRPAGASLEKVAKLLGYGVVTIHAENPEDPGILSQVTSTISQHGIPIRQVLAEDAAICKEASLKVVTEEPLKGAAIEALASIPGVNRVIIER
jgi:hypothetical protein